MTDPASATVGLIERILRRLSGGRLEAGASLRRLHSSDTAKAAGLAGAMIANNLIALVSTIVFARLLSDRQGGGYGALAALVSYFLILSVVGQALQVATAREGALGRLGVGRALLRTVRRWTAALIAFTVLLAAVSVLARAPIADAVGVRHDRWAAALGLPAAGLWLELSVLRGVLQGAGDYRGVGMSLIGEQAARLVCGAILAAAGLGVAGAYLGTPLSFVAMGLYCGHRLRRHVRGLEAASHGAVDEPASEPGLWVHVRRAWAPIWGLIVIAVLQNIDIIAAKHRFATHTDSSYAAVAVAAKVLIWVAMGAGYYLVPEVSRRRSLGEDPRPILVRALAIVAVCAVPVLGIYALAGHPLIELAFGASKTSASGSLPVLGLAFAVLACTYLAVQYLLALRRAWFLLGVSAVAIAEPVALLNASHRPTSFAAVVLAVQAAGAVVAFAFALAGDRSPLAGARSGEPLQEPASPDSPRRVPEPV